MIGLPVASFRASGSEDLTTTQEATGNNDASFFGSSKMNLWRTRVRLLNQVCHEHILSRVVIVRLDFFQLEIEKVFRIKRAFGLWDLGLSLGTKVQVKISSQSNYASTT
jgi:hypothetical protein